ncbi:hypothetical protein [Streptomyces sp. CS131]|uniref:hypothetical protein n=1 Tax=Streptomyces sp. CS131 TaxID=2162711 RepID=UPI000D51C8F3|nr:hypothetical protein [Streptomyces sp. CS131]PVC80232.1 hypothetical protein DBP20_33345 [Streptomyces sp. CS131]
MGLDITLLAVDWAHLRAIPADARTAWLEDAAWPDDQWPPHEEYQSGWTWPEGPGEQHWARYAFTMSSYKPHFWAGRRWDDVRDAAHPELRVALDTYLLALVWAGPDGDVRHDGPVFPGDPWDPEPLAVCRPADLPAVAEAWERAAPLLDTLRAPYAEHAEDPHGWIRDFDQFAAFVQEWSVPVEEAARRGWGLIGLR